MAGHVQCCRRCRYDACPETPVAPWPTCTYYFPGPAHAVYFATYEAVKHLMGGNQAGVHHPLAAATSGACATIASDALMNPFDGM